MDPSEAAGSPAIQAQWDELARTSPHPFAFRQSQEWWDYNLPHSDDVRAAIGVVRAPGGPIVGVVPVRTQNYLLKYFVRSFQIAKTRLRVVNVLGAEPLIPDDECVFANLIRSLLRAFEDCDGVLLDWVSLGSACWDAISRSRDLRREALVCLPRRPYKCHFVTLPDSFDAYLARFKSRTRQHLRRQMRRLRDQGGGRLECLRIEHEGDVPNFVQTASELVLQSRFYQNTGLTPIENTPLMHQKLAQIARRGALRSYLLRCGDDYCAFSLGFHYGQTLYSSFIGFDERFARFSPGTTLHFMTIEDLCGYRPPKRMNLDAGEWPYLDELGTDSLDGVPVLLLRRTIRNRLRGASYDAFRSLVEWGRRLMARSHQTKTTAKSDGQSIEQE